MKYYFLPPVKFFQSWELDEEKIEKMFPGTISPVTCAPTHHLPTSWCVGEQEFLRAKKVCLEERPDSYKAAFQAQFACVRIVEAENYYEAMILVGYMDWDGDDWIFGAEFADIVEHYPQRLSECNEPDDWWWNPQLKIEASKQKQRCLEQIVDLRARRDALHPSWPEVPRESFGSICHSVPGLFLSSSDFL